MRSLVYFIHAPPPPPPPRTATEPSSRLAPSSLQTPRRSSSWRARRGRHLRRDIVVDLRGLRRRLLLLLRVLLPRRVVVRVRVVFRHRENL
ncbi:LOW QUALITY PROTEIN: uncharacterized protein MICPUCDRAFT_63099 [Micromonas pusilla CCMP1545]|uniref:Predicted protein n=1 Tax=Micromonas pusilla (strain CCMP1545) TaxID=564608 RepID=C1N1H5_MICPC|nr:LOW QUALITY PROTEIN: uncharacterized protein MICPUCDRAFT_63099 [Micromonas pusilla CCMP1545]EEH54192.1 predicted protein [Micromonas pusilla CCMP1545]|eukprot:XP_003061562.1 predicted protein [Micromonas pusilla CCMP1545]